MYKTKDDRKAIYISDDFGQDKVVINYDGNFHNTVLHRDTGRYNNYMNYPFDIISEWQEPIDEEKLDELAEKCNPNNPHGDTYEVGQYFGFNDGFKAGFCEAKTE